MEIPFISHFTSWKSLNECLNSLLWQGNNSFVCCFVTRTVWNCFILGHFYLRIAHLANLSVTHFVTSTNTSDTHIRLIYILKKKLPKTFLSATRGFPSMFFNWDIELNSSSLICYNWRFNLKTFLPTNLPIRNQCRITENNLTNQIWPLYLDVTAHSFLY